MQTWFRRRFPHARRRPSHGGRRGGGLWTAGLLGVCLAVALIGYLEFRLWPVLDVMATAKVKNAVTQTLDGTISDQITARGLTYGDFVIMEKDSGGRVTALTSDMAALNQLRTSILGEVVSAVNGLDRAELSIPVGNLSGVNFLSGRGFQLPVEVVAVGSAHAEFENQFSGAGINQTRHQIMLHVTVTVDILLPGETLRTDISAQVPVAETVIVGTVPDTYLELGSP